MLPHPVLSRVYEGKYFYQQMKASGEIVDNSIK